MTLGERLLSMEELAEFCGRSYQHVRDLFREGVLPEPKNIVRHAHKTTRRFTMEEAYRIKRMFDDPAPNKWSDRRRRASVRRQIKEGESVSTKRKR